MILADLVLDLKFDNHFDIMKSHDRKVRYHSDDISFKRKEIRDYYQSKFEQVFTVEFLLDNKKYILGFDKNLLYFYLFNCNTAKVDLFFTKDDIQDSSFACLFDPIFRKEVSV